MLLPKILYPSTPTIPSAPSLSQAAGGALAGRTYKVRLTYVTPYGETTWGAEATLVIDANKLITVASPAASGGPAYSTGYNVYATSGGSGTETKQNASAIDIATDWTEPASGLIAGTAPPASWGATLTFRYPPRFKPSYADESIRHDNVASSGVKEVIYERTDDFIEFDMEWILAADRSAWQAFLAYALQGGAFDFYPDATDSDFDPYVLENMDARLAWKAPSVDTLAGVKMRKRVDWP